MIGLVAGCASIPKREGWQEVEKMTEPRTGISLPWVREEAEAPTAMSTLQAWMASDLTLERALHIALFNNRSLRAKFEDIGIAGGAGDQASVLSNPRLKFEALMPGGGGPGSHKVSVTQNLLDLFVAPSRRGVADAQMERAQLEVSDAVVNLAADVKAAFYTYQGAVQTQMMRQRMFDAAEATVELAKRQKAAGNISDLDIAHQQALYHQAHLAYTSSQADVAVAHEPLARRLGVSGLSLTLHVGASLPELTSADPVLEGLEDLALKQRFDLQVIRQDTQILERTQAIAGVGPSMASAVEMGLVHEQDSSGFKLGPDVELPIPIFDQRGGVTRQLEAQRRQSQQREQAKELDVRTEVRLARTKLLTARQRADYYRDAVLPNAEEIVKRELQHYNFMLRGVYDLLLAKQQEVHVRKELIEALRDYWIARSELERSVGGKLP